MAVLNVPAVAEVRPGIWAIPVPMPGDLVFVRCWLLEADAGPVLIDAGLDLDSSFAALEAGVAAAGHTLADVSLVLFTHAHPDHYGGVRRLRERTDAPVALHEADAAEGVVAAAYRDDRGRLVEALAGFGAEPEEQEALVGGIRHVAVPGAFPQPDRYLGEAERFPVAGGELLAVHTPGHAPGHVCFVHEAAGVVFTGDAVLELTTPHVPASPASAASPLDDYLDSLRRLLAYGDLAGLPSHEGLLEPVGPRTQALLDHHDERLDEAVAALTAEGELTCRGVAERMTWSLPWETYGPFDRMLAMSEALAHLLTLRRRGVVERGDDKPYRWRLA